ncbi:MAG: DUF2127 domain-containing protein [Terriglobales bacterium]|jgi:uncharacterized membrane protein (DUF2068 family)
MNPTLHVPEHIHLPDKQHRDVYALRSVAVFEAIKGILVLAVGFGVWHYRHRDIDDIVDRVVAFFHLNPEGHLSNIFSKAAERMTEKTLVLVAIGAVIYSIIRFAEAYGLWRARAWAEWFALISGTIYVPFEVHALMHHPNPIKWGILVINILIVLYMAHLRMEASRARRERGPVASD